MSEYKVSVRLNDGEVKALLVADITQDAVDDLANAALEMQQTLVPVLTGNLKRHLQIRKTADGLGREVGAFEQPPLLPIPYAEIVEEHQPYIRPSIDAIRKRLRES